jgi:predicted TIM-barrel fold metal-dependent hydrolase
LYDETIYGRATKLTGAESVLFGSDYPLLSQLRSRQRIEEAGLDAATRDRVLGGNAAALLGLA